MKTYNPLGRLAKRVTLRDGVAPVDSTDEMLGSLTTLEVDLKIAYDQKKRDVEELHGYTAAFKRRIAKADALINRASTEQAVQEFQIFRSSAEKFANAYEEAYTKEKVVLTSWEENLKNVRLAKEKLISIKERATLDATLMAFVGSSIAASVEAEPEIDRREIALIVHTANALIELRTESR